MAIKFILGASGSGKSKFCFDEILSNLECAETSENLILLVPEQSTYLCEKEILSSDRIKGYSRLHILSFERLSYWLGASKSALPSLSSIGRELIVGRILRQNFEKLGVFGKDVLRSKFISKVTDIIVEMQKYENSPQDIAEAIVAGEDAGVDHIVIGKLRDVNLIYSEYLDFIEGKYFNHDASLGVAKELVTASSLLNGARVWVDGFSNFNTQEKSLLVELLKVCKQASIAFCLDPETIESQSLCVDSASQHLGVFSPIINTYGDLVSILRKVGLEVLPPKLLTKNYRHNQSSSLWHIESNIFSGSEITKVAPDENVKIFALKNLRSEVDFVAGEISKIIRREKLRYQDIAIVVPDIDGYAGYIRASFGEYGIPYFVDQKKTMRHHILVDMLCSAITMACGEITTSQVVNYLKTSLAPLDDLEIGQLENRAITSGFQESHWLGASSQIPEDIEHLRKAALCEVLNLRNKFSASSETMSGVEFSGMIFDFIESLDVAEKLKNLSENLLESGDPETASEHMQLYSRIIDILDEINEVFGEEEIKTEELAAVFIDMICDIELAFVPPAQDQVMIGSIERTRHPEISVMFLLGATNSQFPAPVSQATLFGDCDREIAASLKLELSQQSTQKLMDREYLAYIAYTRSREKLYITHPLENSKGDEIQISAFVTQLSQLFEPPIISEHATSSLKNLSDITTTHQLDEYFCTSLGKDSNLSEGEHLRLLGSIFSQMKSSQRFGVLGKRIDDALKYTNSAKLDEESISRMYENSLSCSVSRISNFVSCPFKHFSSYILKLRERKKLKLEPVDMGSFLHKVLEVVSRELLEKNLDFATAAQDQLKELTDTAIEISINENGFLCNYKKNSRHNSFVIDALLKTLYRCVAAIAEMAKAGEFHLHGVEYEFGDAASDLGECAISDSSGRSVKLRGFIDRLDVRKTGEKYSAVVFDYKLNGKAVNWSKLYHGLDTQLLVYLMAIENMSIDGKRVSPIGGFFIPIEVSPTSEDLVSMAKKSQGSGYKARGILNGEYALDLDRAPVNSSQYYDFSKTKTKGVYARSNNGCVLKPQDFKSLIAFGKEKLISSAGKLMDGEIDVLPYRLGKETPCKYCEYRSLCRFDSQLNEHNDLEKVDKKGVVVMLEECENGQ